MRPPVGGELVEVAARLREGVAALGPVGAAVTHVYNPLDYAWEPHRRYLERYADRPAAVLVGMNPGPWGMAQTGVPFGDVLMVRDWLGIEAQVLRPQSEHPRRPVEGFACRRREVSGQRLWGWARDAFGTPDAFFERFFVLNYCPLCFMEESGRNRTPDKLPASYRERLFAACDPAVRAAVQRLGVAHAIGVGGFAAQRLEAALEGLDVHVGRILHPSPANPRANQGWAPEVERSLREMGLTPNE